MERPSRRGRGPLQGFGFRSIQRQRTKKRTRAREIDKKNNQLDWVNVVQDSMTMTNTNFNSAKVCAQRA